MFTYIKLPNRQKLLLLLNYFTISIVDAFPIFALRKFLQTRGVSIGDIGILLGVFFAPWILKFVFSSIIDKYTFDKDSDEYKKILTISYIIGGIIHFILSLTVGEIHLVLFTILYTLSQICICIIDVVSDSILVTITSDEEGELLGTTMVNTDIVRALGKGFSSLIGAAVYSVVSESGTFVILCIIHLLMAVLMFKTGKYISKTSTTSTYIEKPTLKIQVINTWKLLTKSVKYVLLFNFLIYILPTFEEAFFWFLHDERNFSNTEMGLLGMFSSIAQAFGIKYFRNFVNTNTIRHVYSSILISGTIVEVIFTTLLTTMSDICLGLPQLLVAILGDILSALTSSVLTLPLRLIVTNASDSSTRNVTYAFTLSLLNMLTMFSGVFSKLVMILFGIEHNIFTHLTGMVLLCVFLEGSVLGIFTFYKLIPDKTIKEFVEDMDLIKPEPPIRVNENI